MPVSMCCSAWMLQLADQFQCQLRDVHIALFSAFLATGLFYGFYYQDTKEGTLHNLQPLQLQDLPQIPHLEAGIVPQLQHWFPFSLPFHLQHEAHKSICLLWGLRTHQGIDQLSWPLLGLLREIQGIWTAQDTAEHQHLKSAIPISTTTGKVCAA